MSYLDKNISRPLLGDSVINTVETKDVKCKSILQEHTDCIDLSTEKTENEDDKDEPQTVFNEMVQKFSKKYLTAIDLEIKPYEYKKDHREFLPKKVRRCIQQGNDYEKINGEFHSLSMQFFCKFEFMKGVKKGDFEKDMNDENENDRHFLLVKTWQKVRFTPDKNQQGDFKNNTAQFKNQNTHTSKNQKPYQKDDSTISPIIHKQTQLEHQKVQRNNQKKQSVIDHLENQSVQTETVYNQKKVPSFSGEKQNENYDQDDKSFDPEEEDLVDRDESNLVKNDEYFYVKTIQIFDDSINRIKEFLVEMIPVAQNQVFEEAYDTSTFLLANKLWFFRRSFTDDGNSSTKFCESEFHAECRLWSYNLSTEEISNQQGEHDQFKDLRIDEVDEVQYDVNDLVQAQIHSPKLHVLHKHMKNIIFSEEFGQNQHETINQLLEKSVEAYEKEIDQKEEEKKYPEDYQNQEKIEEEWKREKNRLMKEFQHNEENKILSEQYILVQSYNTEDDDIKEKFNIFSIKEMLEESCEEGLLGDYFGKQDGGRNKYDNKQKIEQIFHIKNYKHEPNIVHFLIVEKQKISHFITNNWKTGEVKSFPPYYFDENHNNFQKMKQWVQINIKSTKLQSYDENDQLVRIEQFYFIDQYNQIQLLFPLYDMKLEKIKRKDLIENQIKFEHKDPSLFKMIHRVTDVPSDQDDSKIFQSYSYLKLLLRQEEKQDNDQEENKDNDMQININQDMHITYVQHGYHQYMMINPIQGFEDQNKDKQTSLSLEPQQANKKLIFYTLSENDQFYHLCQKRQEMLSERGFKNIAANEIQQTKQQAYVRRETIQHNQLIKEHKDEQIFHQYQQEQNHAHISDLIRTSIIQKILKRDSINPSSSHEKQNQYNLKDGNLKINLMYSKDPDLQSDNSDLMQNKVLIEDPEKAHDKNEDKVYIKTHLNNVKDDKNDIILLINQVVRDTYQFVFVIENNQDDEKYVVKNKTYFLLQRTREEMKKIKKNEDGDTIIKNDNKQKLDVLRGIDKEGNIIFEKMTYKELIEVQKTYQSDKLDDDDDYITKPKKDKKKDDKEELKRYFSQKKIKLSYSQIQSDNQNLNFIPFVYQEANEDKNNRLIIYDITQRKVTSTIIINPDQNSKDMINLNEKDSTFKSYQLCFSSDVEVIGQNKNKQKQNYQVKLSLATFFQESYGRIQIQEFLIKNADKVGEIKIVSLKQIFFSKELLQIYQQSGYIKNCYIAPFHLQNHEIKGVQLVWHKDKTDEEENEEEFNEHQQEGKEEEDMFINLLDQDKNNIYQFETKIANFGQRKFMLNGNNPEIYAVVISATLKKDVIEKNIFENMETIMILSVINEITAGIKIADLRYLMLNSFETMKQKDFFKNQEIFLGKSFCDICLKDADEIGRAIQSHDEKDEMVDIDDLWPTESHIFKLCGNDQQRIQMMKKTGFIKKDMTIQQDFNFKGTIQKAIESKSFQTLKTMMKHIFDQNEHVYQDLIMFNLKNLLECSKIEINEFFERTITEKKNQNDEPCNLEISFKNIKLPEFSEKPYDYMKMPKLNDFNLWKTEIEDKIKARDKDDEAKKNYEIEHSYIDFQQMIIGEKIRAFNKGVYNYEFNDFKLCKLMKPNTDSLEFYKGQTIQRIIQYQWQTSRNIYKFVFYLYLFTFAMPFYVSQMTSELKTRQVLLKVCMFPMCLMLISEIIQFTTTISQARQAKSSNKSWKFKEFYGIPFVLLFFSYAIPEVMNTFTPAAENERQINDKWNPNEVLPELLFTILLLSFIKLLQFIRVYEEFGFFIDMFIYCLKGLETFIISFIAFLIFFTFCYIQLNIEAMEAVSHAQGTGFFEDMFFGTYRCAIQELSMPKYRNLSEVKPMTSAIQWNIYIIWIMYIFQAFLMAVVFLNFIIGVISSVYNKVYDHKYFLKFKQQASINDECFTLIDLYNKVFKRKDLFKVLVFSSSIEGNVLEEDQFEEQIDQLKKFVSKQNKDVISNHETISNLFNEVGIRQKSLEDLTVKMFDELDKNQSEISQQIIESIHQKNLKQAVTPSHQSQNRQLSKQLQSNFVNNTTNISPVKDNLQVNVDSYDDNNMFDGEDQQDGDHDLCEHDLSDADISEDDDYRLGINVHQESPMMDAHNETITRNSEYQQ